jgi:TetR/AcrR family transcriptional regulator, transcriptional repressor for nem operon
VRLSKEQTAENRERILDTAIRLFRRHGIEGVGIAELMRAAGFTHGGFYNHFRSKEALVVEACRLAFVRTDGALTGAVKTAAPNVWRAYVASFLSAKSDADPSEAATIAALAPDSTRSGVELQRVFAQSIETVVGAMSQSAPPRPAAGSGGRAVRALALHRLSALVGGWMLARAVGRASPRLAKEILQANRRMLDAEEVPPAPVTRTRRRVPRRC